VLVTANYIEDPLENISSSVIEMWCVHIGVLLLTRQDICRSGCLGSVK